MARWCIFFLELLAASTLANVPREIPCSRFRDCRLVSGVREPSGESTTLTYDPLGRLTNRVDAVGTTVFRYDPNGSLTNVLEGAQSNCWTFDVYDRVSTYRDADGNLFQYGYDGNGNLTSLVYPGGKTVLYFYDALNQLTNVTDWASRQTSFEYDVVGRLTRIRRFNGTVRSVGYDDLGQVTNITESSASSGAVAFFLLNWTNAGRIMSEFGLPLAHAFTVPSRTMTFDDDNRIATFNGVAVVHDLDGNMTSGPLTNNTFAALTYNARNQLTSAGGINYGYDPLGQRTSIAVGTNVTKLVINPNAGLSQVLMRVKNGVTNYYVYGLGLLYEADDAGNTKTYHYDYRGSTIALTDGLGRVTDRIEYTAYGLMAYRSGSTETPFLFNGRYGVMTEANGLLFMRARFYNPYLCRFINADPAGFGGGLNWFAFADGNPVNLVDPFGLCATEQGPFRYWFADRLSAYYGRAQGLLDAGTTLAHGAVGLARENDPTAILFPGRYDWADRQVSAGSDQVQDGLDWGARKVGARNDNYTFVLNALAAESATYIATVLLGGRESPGGKAPGNLSRAAEETTTLYRGVNESHVFYEDAQAGVVKPNGGTATPIEHNTVPGASLNSPYTSWTRDPSVAENFALRPGGQGVVIKAEVPASQITPSPNLKQVMLIQNGQIVSESEVLVRGTVQGTARTVTRP